MPTRSRKPERLVAVFLLGLALFNYPLLTVFNIPVRIWGVPMLYGFLFAAWALLILLLRILVKDRADPLPPSAVRRSRRTEEAD